jgi:ankyrin repeat protein
LHEEIEYSDGRGETALRVASYWETTEVVEILLSAGAEVNRQNTVGNVPLGKPGRLRALIEANANCDGCNFVGETPLHMVPSWASREFINILGGKSDIGAIGASGVTIPDTQRRRDNITKSPMEKYEIMLIKELKIFHSRAGVQGPFGIKGCCCILVYYCIRLSGSADTTYATNNHQGV